MKHTIQVEVVIRGTIEVDSETEHEAMSLAEAIVQDGVLNTTPEDYEVNDIRVNGEVTS